MKSDKRTKVRQIAFGDMAALVRETINPEDAEGLPYIGLEHIQEGELHLKGVGKAEDTISTKFKFCKGDILFGKLRPYFRKVIIAPFDGVCSTDIWVVRAKSGFDQKFLFYCMASQAFVKFASQGSEGTRMPRAKWEHVSRFCLPFFTLPEQKAIAHILGTLDDKIELNRRMNETLEEMAKAIFKSWFVDFDPVIDNALKAGNPIPDALAEKAARRRAILEKLEKEDSNLPKLSPEIARLFPDSFEDSPLGPIPRGWRVKRVSDLGKVVCGKTPPTKDKTNYGKEVPFITIPDMHGKVFVVQTTKYLSKKGADLQSNKYLPPYSICVSCIATPGLVVMTSEISQTNQQINSVIPYKEISPFFAFLTLKILGKEIMQIGSGGSVFTNLSKSRFKNLNILMPTNNLIEIFHKHIASLFLSILNNEKEILNLANIRDTLLPKLISGQIRIKDAEKFVGKFCELN
ncbi:restriction modification system DNA specificity domain protein [Thermodesulfatator indicus DSM 15286]|uniref:Restriction modification system DNA specificity domain protein n=1 Tax=Thermodesulfatator indicus (strain DSM 15286 / JCM 11887 / CIR29812) TaxID=667014 RepID=F8AAS3_THEID|nr:restriction endonuclease subunit S [Thermodesulfatator indicus]AEH45434.1 restriction modification system DNA specificity domain protein [Thermodesulfatator indicus DSM 15286]